MRPPSPTPVSSPPFSATSSPSPSTSRPDVSKTPRRRNWGESSKFVEAIVRKSGLRTRQGGDAQGYYALSAAGDFYGGLNTHAIDEVTELLDGARRRHAADPPQPVPLTETELGPRPASLPTRPCSASSAGSTPPRGDRRKKPEPERGPRPPLGAKCGAERDRREPPPRGRGRGPLGPLEEDRPVPPDRQRPRRAGPVARGECEAGGPSVSPG